MGPAHTTPRTVARAFLADLSGSPSRAADAAASDAAPGGACAAWISRSAACSPSHSSAHCSSSSDSVTPSGRASAHCRQRSTGGRRAFSCFRLLSSSSETHAKLSSCGGPPFTKYNVEEEQDPVHFEQDPVHTCEQDPVHTQYLFFCAHLHTTHTYTHTLCTRRAAGAAEF